MEAALHARSGSSLAVGLLSENSHPGSSVSKAELHRVIELANSLHASGLAASLYDEGGRSRSTGKERDSETGLDYFGARYYGGALGRFTSADWSPRQEPVPYADFENPQTLNLYTYGNNNPLKNRDLDGHCTVDGEQHFGWCLWHTLGFYQTEKEQANTARQALSPMHGFTINGQTPAEIAQNGTNQEVITAQRTAIEFLAREGMRLCASGVSCGVVVPPVGGGAAWVRVGRWMSTEELGEMQASGVAQESRALGGSRVALPASADAYKNSPAGSVYVEYDIPAGVAKPAGSGWARIPGPNSVEGRSAAAAGRPISGMPEVRNITVVKSK